VRVCGVAGCANARLTGAGTLVCVCLCLCLWAELRAQGAGRRTTAPRYAHESAGGRAAGAASTGRGAISPRCYRRWLPSPLPPQSGATPSSRTSRRPAVAGRSPAHAATAPSPPSTAAALPPPGPAVARPPSSHCPRALHCSIYLLASSVRPCLHRRHTVQATDRVAERVNTRRQPASQMLSALLQQQPASQPASQPARRPPPAAPTEKGTVPLRTGGGLGELNLNQHQKAI
jgi:hypothetical protein